MGAGVDLITACDIRYCTADARFCVKEVDLAIVADMGTLQRLPGIVGQGVAEAARIGLVTRCFSDTPAMMEAVGAVAQQLATKSPVAVTGTKRIMLHSRCLPRATERRC